MLSQLIRSILDENNPSTSSCMEDRMSLFEDKAEDKKMRIQANNFLSQASIYSADLDTVQKNRFYFLKPALKGMKQNFLADFEEYLLSRSIESAPVKNLVSMFSHFIPDTFYPEWSATGLEDRLVIFDLLLSLLIGCTLNNGDRLKMYFDELLKLYSLVAVYSSVLVKDCDDDFEKIANFLEVIDDEEERLKRKLFDVLVSPSEVRKDLDKYLNELEEENEFIDNIIDDSFQNAIHYSKLIVKKVIANELSRFEPLFLLSRYRFESLYEWISALEEYDTPWISEKLLRDLEI
ncbi:MAG: hypothetical protein II220_07430 [Spirochaetales bacterium]|nr:hypothetical protein [Spirochaetales bacterium]